MSEESKPFTLGDLIRSKNANNLEIKKVETALNNKDDASVTHEIPIEERRLELISLLNSNEAHRIEEACKLVEKYGVNTDNVELKKIAINCLDGLVKTYCLGLVEKVKEKFNLDISDLANFFRFAYQNEKIFLDYGTRKAFEQTELFYSLCKDYILSLISHGNFYEILEAINKRKFGESPSDTEFLNNNEFLDKCSLAIDEYLNGKDKDDVDEEMLDIISEIVSKLGIPYDVNKEIVKLHEENAAEIHELQNRLFTLEEELDKENIDTKKILDACKANLLDIRETFGDYIIEINFESFKNGDVVEISEGDFGYDGDLRSSESKVFGTDGQINRNWKRGMSKTTIFNANYVVSAYRESSYSTVSGSWIEITPTFFINDKYDVEKLKRIIDIVNQISNLKKDEDDENEN